MNVTYIVEIDRVTDLWVGSLTVWPRSWPIWSSLPCHGKILTVSRLIRIKTIKM